MTAGELIKILKRVPKDAEVSVGLYSSLEVSLKRSSDEKWSVVINWVCPIGWSKDQNE